MSPEIIIYEHLGLTVSQHLMIITIIDCSISLDITDCYRNSHLQRDN